MGPDARRLGLALALGLLPPARAAADPPARGLDPSLLESRFASWGISPKERASINLLGAWRSFEKKRDVVVAVVDTGVDFDHPFLKGSHHVAEGKVGAGNYGVDFSRYALNKTAPDDSHGHGTHIAGIIKSVNPEARILSLKYYDQNASGYDNLTATVEALRYAIRHGVDIINYSGGGAKSSKEELGALREAERKGILVVAAAGNEGSDIDVKSKAYYPASYGLPNIISVAAHDRKLHLLPSSNHGDKSVGLTAPGSRIRSSLPGGGRGFLTGTSQGTAFVTAAASLIKSKHPGLPYGEVKKLIYSSAKKEPGFLRKCLTQGRPDTSAALLAADRSSKGGGKPPARLAGEKPAGRTGTKASPFLAE